MREALDFSNAMAALNCTAIGARGGISYAGCKRGHCWSGPSGARNATI